WFLLNTLAFTFWFSPQEPVSKAVGSVYAPRVTAPQATPFLVMTLYQSIPSFPPSIHFPPSEIGSSSRRNRVLFGLLLGWPEIGPIARRPRTKANNAIVGSSSGLPRSALIVPWFLSLAGWALAGTPASRNALASRRDCAVVSGWSATWRI